MKRILSIVMIVVLCAAFMATAAFADGAAVLSVTSATGEAGETIDLTVSVSEAEFATYGVKVQCPEGLEIVSFEQGAASKGFFSGVASTGIASAVNSEDYTANGVLFTVKLKIKDTAAAGDYTVNVLVDNFTTADRNAVGVTGSYGTVTVEADEPTHTHAYEWMYDENGHWQECQNEGCDAQKINEGDHSYSNYVANNDGVTETGTCECGRTNTRDIVGGGEVDPSPTDPGQDPTPTDPGQGGEGGEDPVVPTTPVTPSDPTVSDKTGDNVLPFLGIGIVVLAAAAVIFTRKQKA